MLGFFSRKSTAEKAADTVAKHAKAWKAAAASQDCPVPSGFDFSQLSDRAQELAGKTRDWAAPRAEQAWKETVKVAAPKIEAASEAVRPRIDAAHDKVVSDYLPRVQKAMHEAAEAAQADGSLRDRAEKVASVTSQALTEPTKKGHPVLKGFGLTALAALVGAAGYVLWRRSQPIEDPWAEEYWADLEAKTSKVDFESEAAEAEERAEEAVANMELKDPKEAAEKAGDKVKEAADKAGDKAKEVAEDAKDKAEKAGDKVKEAADKAGDKAKEVAEDAKDKAEDVIDEAKDKLNK